MINSQKNNQRYARLLLLVCFLIFPITYFSLNYFGFCFKEFRYLSDYEQQEILFNWFNDKTEFRKLDELEGKGNYTIIPYNSFEKYRQLYPNCCSIGKARYGRRGKVFDFIERIFGYYGARAGNIQRYVKYTTNGEEKMLHIIHDGDYLNNCGGVQTF